MSTESLDEMAKVLVEEMIANTGNRFFNFCDNHQSSSCPRGVRDVVFCESFLDYVQRHPLLQRAILSR